MTSDKEIVSVRKNTLPFKEQQTQKERIDILLNEVTSRNKKWQTEPLTPHCDVCVMAFCLYVITLSCDSVSVILMQWLDISL